MDGVFVSGFPLSRACGLDAFSHRRACGDAGSLHSGEDVPHHRPPALAECGYEGKCDSLRDEIQKRPRFTFGLLLFFAFTPLPSNSVFIAYGLTTMSILRIAIPFFLGRLVSYTFWAKGAAIISRKVEVDGGAGASGISAGISS